MHPQLHEFRFLRPRAGCQQTGYDVWFCGYVHLTALWLQILSPLSDLSKPSYDVWFFGTVHARAAYNSMDVDFDTSERSSKRSCDFWFFEAVVRVRLQRADWDFGTSERVLKPDNAVWFFGQRVHASTIPWTYDVQQLEKCGFKMQNADSCSLPKAVKFFRYLQFSSCVATCCFQVASKNLTTNN